jgi:hypothetical protein
MSLSHVQGRNISVPYTRSTTLLLYTRSTPYIYTPYIYTGVHKETIDGKRSNSASLVCHRTNIRTDKVDLKICSCGIQDSKGLASPTTPLSTTMLLFRCYLPMIVQVLIVFSRILSNVVLLRDCPSTACTYYIHIYIHKFEYSIVQ